MKAFGRVVGWLLLLGGAIGIIAVVWAIVTQRIPGNFLAGLLMCAPIVLVMVVGGWLTRIGRRNQEWASSDAPAWTRRGPV